MSKYGVTDKGFVLKRLDTIMDEIHSDLTEGFGVDTSLSDASFLNVLVTSFSNQIAEIWETAQDSYYAKYPATATGVNLDNAVQYGGIQRAGNKRTCYSLHCTGEDGVYVRDEAVVATNTLPEIRLFAANEFRITREAFNSVVIAIAVATVGLYTITINGQQYCYSSESDSEDDILTGLKDSITNDEYIAIIKDGALVIEDSQKGRSNMLVLSENLTTVNVTTIANFYTQEYGKIIIPCGVVTKMINNIAGFTAVTNLLEPVYGRLQESDVELRKSYIAKSALRSNTMIDSIVAELLNNVANVESASGYENYTDKTNSMGMPPHSVEIVVEGGDDNSIAEAILRRKAGGIQTHGSITVDVPGKYGDVIPISFNRPEHVYAWLKVVLHGDSDKLPSAYVQLVTQSLVEDSSQLVTGNSLLTQLLTEGIYDAVAGVTYVDIYTAYSTDKAYIPDAADYHLNP